jgi:hypothetical protein
MNFYRLTLILMTFVLSTTKLSAQNEIVHLYGQVKDQFTKKKLENVTVQIFKDGALFDNINAGSSGKYDVKLPLGFTYDIKFTMAGYLAKVIRMDTRNIPEEDRYGGFDMGMDGSLFPYREGFNTDILKEPMAKALYNPAGDGFDFDLAYSKKKQDEIDAEFKRLDDLAAGLAKLQADFDKFVKAGDQGMTEKKYQDAVTNYKSALGIFPDKEDVKRKLADAQAKLDAENANKEVEAAYRKLIEEGDAFYKDKKYSDARAKYVKAKELKNATYENDMIYKIDQLLADADKRKQYDALIATADGKFTGQDYAGSITTYKDALKLYPTEIYPQDQIQKAEQAMRDLAANKAEQERIERDYQAKLELARKSESADDLPQAIVHYKAALNIKPSESLPQEKINELEGILADRKSRKDRELADEQARLEAEWIALQERYQATVKEADALYASKDYEQARDRYTQAKGIKESEDWKRLSDRKVFGDVAYENEMLYKIEQGLVDAEKRGRYDAIIADGDKHFTDGDYAVSIEKYQEAAAIYPSEAYPKNQILIAESKIREMMDAEQEKIRRRQEFDNMLTLASIAEQSQSWEQALVHYQSAHDLIPEEQLPVDKIAEMEAKMAELTAQDDERKRQRDAEQAELERIETEYQAKVQSADELFAQSQLEQARAGYEDALRIKPEASYPRSRIEAIDLMIAQEQSDRQRKEMQALQDSLDYAARVELEAVELERKRIEEEARAADLARRQAEAERLAQEEEERQRKKSRWNSDVDTDQEDQVEKFYRDAGEKEYAANVKRVEKEQQDAIELRDKRREDAEAIVSMNEDAIANQVETRSESGQIGDAFLEASIRETERNKRLLNQSMDSNRDRQEMRTSESQEKSDRTTGELMNHERGDRQIEQNVREVETQMQDAEKNQDRAENKADINRKINSVDIAQEQRAYERISEQGDLVRIENGENLNNQSNYLSRRADDQITASEQRHENAQLVINREKEIVNDLGQGAEGRTWNASEEIRGQQMQMEMSRYEITSNQKNATYANYDSLYAQERGTRLLAEDFREPENATHLREGVTESNRQEGNKMIIERAVRVGNRVDIYNKVISKYSIYYFKNGSSITEEMWIAETMNEHD